MKRLYEIKHHFSGKVLFSIETSLLKLAVETAVKDKANLAGANLFGANLADANLADAYLAETNLADAYLAGTYLVGANLAGANLVGAYLAETNLAEANLAEANLADAYLVGVNLAGANLVGAYLAGANLARANLAETNLVGANLAETNLADAKIRGGIKIKQKPIQIFTHKWPIIIFDEHMQIGCEFHSLIDWFSYDDEGINKMDRNALKFWRTWKEPLIAICIKNKRYDPEEKPEEAA